jgi:hypothetical protein
MRELIASKEIALQVTGSFLTLLTALTIEIAYVGILFLQPLPQSRQVPPTDLQPGITVFQFEKVTALSGLVYALGIRHVDQGIAMDTLKDASVTLLQGF